MRGRSDNRHWIGVMSRVITERQTERPPTEAGYGVHTSTHQPRFAPPAPQIWGEVSIFCCSKSPRIGGFRGQEKVKQKIKNLCYTAG
jgi:hypothetical protein